MPTENTAKWIREHHCLPERRQALEGYAARLARAYPSPATRQLQLQAREEWAAYRRWALRPGRLVIVEKASMAATKDLDYLPRAATAAGGEGAAGWDWAQLSPVQAGGAFKLLRRYPSRRPAPG